MIKIWILRGVQTIFVSSVLFFLYDGYSKVKRTAPVLSQKSELTYLPEFSLENLNGGSYDHKNLNECMAYLIIYFNSDCSNCIDKIELLNRFYDKFRNTQIIFVSTQPREDLIAVKEKYPLFSKPNVLLLIDAKSYFSATFKAFSYPTFFIYDNEKRLVERIDHSIGIKSLLQITRYASRNT